MTQSSIATIGKEPARRAAAHSAVGHKYRPEIDGLRAVAVLPVILFHAGFELFGGGYVGVDVFFVISGYLITSIILRERETGSFSLASFYERRARRILPALFLIMLLCLVPAWWLMLPGELENFGASLIATSAFASNILFWQTSGYFDGATELKPLLHTWSLGIEEQFYLGFPLLVAFLARWKGSLFFACILAAIGSLFLSVYLTPIYPGASFYLLPTRAWELLAGSLLAMGGVAFAQERLPQPGREILGWLGMLGILLPIFFYDENTAFPGTAAIAPVLGTALIIAVGDEKGLLGRVLTLRPLLWIGAISYSAYLWHQPVFAFVRLLWDEVDDLTWLGLAAFSIGMAHLSWRYIEAPFRSRRNFTRGQIFAFSAAGSLFFIAVGGALFLAKGVPQRFDADVRSLLEPEKSAIESCPLAEDGLYRCELGIGDREPEIVLLGDSHAYAIADELDRELTETGRSGVLLYTSCHPIPGFYTDDFAAGVAREESCQRENLAMLRAATQSSIEGIIVAIRWTPRLYPMGDAIQSVGFDNGEGGVERDLPHRTNLAVEGTGRPSVEVAAKSDVLAAYLTKLAEEKPVAVLYPVPEVGWQPNRLNLRRIAADGVPLQTISTSSARFRERNRAAISALDSVVHPNIRRVRPSDLFCDTVLEGRCVVQYGGVLYYYDDDHVSNHGARPLVSRLLAELPTGGVE